MINGILLHNRILTVRIDFFHYLVLVGVCLCLITCATAQSQISTSKNESITVENVPDQELIIFAKNVIVTGEARGVLVFGGDITIVGEVTGDVGAIGGSVVHKEGGLIGGDVFVIGGRYTSESRDPLRGEGRETLVYAGYEQELRAYAQQPSLLFSPTVTWSFLIQRLFSLVFWFLIGLLITMISPGAVSRAIARTRTRPMSIAGVGTAGLLLSTVGVIASVGLFPGAISGTFGLVVFLLIIFSYVFGRTVLQATVGKLILRSFNPNSKPSETYSILAGALFWTILLSLPYIWIATLFLLFAASIGLIITARNGALTTAK